MVKMVEDVYLEFPNEDCYNKYLLNLRWGKQLNCPYCNSVKNSNLGSVFSYHCNLCNTNFSLTVNTVMHNTKVELRKWLITLHLYLNNEKLSYRRLSKIIKVNKNTAYRMIKELQYPFLKKRLTVLKIAGLNKEAIEVMSLMLLIDLEGRS